MERTKAFDLVMVSAERVKAIAIATVEQGMFGAANAVVSWFAARSLGVDSLAAFFLVWVWSWSIVAVLSEAIGTPLGLAIGRGELSETAQARLEVFSARAAGSFALVASILIVLTKPPAALTALGLIAPGFTLVLIRRFRYMTASYRLLLWSTLARVALVVLACAALSVCGEVNAATLTAVAVAAAAFGTLAYRPITSASSDASPKIREMCGRALRTGGLWLAGGTLLRIVGFSAGLASVLAWRGDRAGVATLAALGSIASFPQLFSGSLPMVLQPPLLRSMDGGAQQRRETARYLFTSLSIAMCIGLVVAVLYQPFRALLLGDSDAGLLIANDRLPFTALAVALITSTCFSGYLAAVNKTRANFLITAAVAPTTLLAAAASLPAAWLSALPYGLHTMAAGAICVRDALMKRPMP